MCKDALQIGYKRVNNVIMLTWNVSETLRIHNIFTIVLSLGYNIMYMRV